MRNYLPLFSVHAKRFLCVWIVILLATTAAWAQSASERVLQTKVTVDFEDATMLDVLNTLQKRSGINFVFDHNELRELPNITRSFTDATIETVLRACLAGTRHDFSVVNGVITIKRITNVERITVFGTVTDAENHAIPGVTVILKGTTVGVAADTQGNYRISFPKRDEMVLVFSFVGMETREYRITADRQLDVTLDEVVSTIDDVVVNGYFVRNRETYTGSVTTITGEELLAISTNDLIGALTALTPGMVIVENNAAGSNPNYVPEILIRGMNSIVTSDEERAYNYPLIMLDGVEISTEELYDLDPFDIERIDVLKDATATVVYGDRASNGVIVIESKRITERKTRLTYNFTPSYSFPELSSLNLANAAQKLEFERLAGMYETTDGSLDRAYAYKLENVRRGVDTDWARAPLRVSLGHQHSLMLTGGADRLDYKASLSVGDKYGVMKGDNRLNFGLNFMIKYHLSDKFTIDFKSSVSQTRTKDSPYGNFSDYTRLNPYYPVYDENGEMFKGYQFDPFDIQSPSHDDWAVNPLYRATLSNFSKSRQHSLDNSLFARYYFNRFFFITAQADLGFSGAKSERFTSPEDPNQTIFDTNKRGEYRLSGNDAMNYSGKLVVNYSKVIGSEGTGFSLAAGGEIRRSRKENFGATYMGFMKDHLNDIKYAMGYANARNGIIGGEDLSANVNFFFNGGFQFRGRYSADFSVSTAGSSKFGSDNRWAPFWSFGLAWIVNNEAWFNVEWVDYLKFRGSLGYTGNVSFSPYQAMTTYNYNENYMYYTGIGAVPIVMGNPRLKWEKTFNRNIAMDLRMLEDRLTFSVDYYNNKTVDMLVPVQLPASVGTDNVKVNAGEMTNQGIELSLSAQLVKRDDFTWSVHMNGSHQFDRLENIGEVLKGLEYVMGSYYAGNDSKRNKLVMPALLFRMGGSQFDIYTVRSAGIDPATGREIFIKRNGSFTYEYDPADRVAVGNTNPFLRGSIGTTLRYKNLSLNVRASYSFGSDEYNSTLYGKVENVDEWFNIDARAYTERWKQPGDLSRYLKIGERDNFLSERFVEKKNELIISYVNLNYELTGKTLEKLGLKRLNVGFGMSDLAHFSTIKLERGTSYPYSRNFSITLRPVF